MTDFDRRDEKNTFPIIKNETTNPVYTYRSTPEGVALKGTDQLQFLFASRSETIPAAKASLTVDAGGSFTVEANDTGSDGNDISIELVDPDSSGEELSVEVDDKAITVNLATNNDGDIDSDTQAVVDAINDNSDASDLVTAKDVADGSTTATTFGPENLSDGHSGNSIDTDLERIKVEIRTENRRTSDDQIVIDLPGPASSDITDNSNYNSVRDYIKDFKEGDLEGDVENQSDQNTAGKELADAGFDFHFTGGGSEGMWTITIPGDATDDQYTVNTPEDDSKSVLPGGIVHVNVEVRAKDEFGNFYYWGDNSEDYDDVRTRKYYTPYMRDLDDDGKDEPTLLVAKADDTDTGLDYGIAFNNLSPDQVVTVIDTIDTGGDVGPDVNGDDAIIDVANALESPDEDFDSVDEAVNNSQIVADVPTFKEISSRGGRLQAAVVDGEPKDDGKEGEIRVTADNLYVYVDGTWKSTGLS